MVIFNKLVTSKTIFSQSRLIWYQFLQCNRKMSSIKFSSENVVDGSKECPGFLHGDGRTKGLIVLQEWWGLNDQIKEEAKQIGDLGGFMVLSPDLYRGKVAIDAEQAGHYMNNLDWPGAIKDIQGAAQFLMKQGCKKVGVTGFCMGGALSLAAAINVPEISAAAPFYGIPSAEFFDVSKIQVPVQAHFGAVDALEGFSSPADAFKLLEKLKHRSDFELLMYGNCGHAFTNPTGPLGNYNKEACELAFKRMVDFMNKNLSESDSQQQKQ